MASKSTQTKTAAKITENENGYSLGTRKYPLFKFAHDYVKIQNLDTREVEKEEEQFLAQKKAEAAQSKAGFFFSKKESPHN